MFADKVLKNGNIYSFDIKGRTAEGSAVAVTGEKITAVGTDKEIERFIGPETDVIECNGNTVMPGFVDAHAHPSIAASILKIAVCLKLLPKKKKPAGRLPKNMFSVWLNLLKKMKIRKSIEERDGTGHIL